MNKNEPPANSLRKRLHEIIFEAETPAGKAFDILLLMAIFSSVMVVLLESVEDIRLQYQELFYRLEWGFTILFTLEYILRLYAVRRPYRYATSFFGIIDLLAILPAYLSLLFAGAQYLLVIRALRLLRVFRIFKLGHFLSAGDTILQAMRASRAKIIVFLSFVMLLVTVIGALMYLIEGQSNDAFENIPKAIYWAIVTLTTVGYGDITPKTGFGQFFSALVMILGYAIIAVPTGIVSAEFIGRRAPVSTQACPSCSREGHEVDAKFCKFCGSGL